jgi:hypothetical protein
MSKNLWEVKHPYYCEGQNFFRRLDSSTQTEFEYKTFALFLSEWGEADKDYNLLFRWDWKDWKEENEDGSLNFNGDVNYRNGELILTFMTQRKGYHAQCRVEVCRADEPAVIEYLRPHWDHMKSLWEPLS